MKHFAGFWYDVRDPWNSHFNLILQNHFVVLTLMAIVLIWAVAKPTTPNVITAYAVYTAVNAIHVHEPHVIESIQPQIQLGLLLRILPKILYGPAAVFGILTGPPLFQLVSIGYFTQKMTKCIRSSKLFQTNKNTAVTAK